MKLSEVLKAETKLVVTDIAIMLTIIGGVLLYSFLYPQPYAKESVSALPISVVDLDKSDISRDIIFTLNATPGVNVIRHDSSQKDALNAIEDTLVKGIVIIPAHFKRDITLGISPTIAVGADSAYFLIYGSILEASMSSILTESAKIKIANLLKRQLPLSGAKQEYTPFTINSINLFNKDNSYTQYVIPAVFILILQQTLLIGLGILGGGINERMKNGDYGIYLKAKSYQLILSRIILFGTIFFIHMLFYFGFSYENFHITHIANMGELLMLGILFLLATLMFGIFLGSLFSSREIATPAILFSSLPLVFSIGFIWPMEAIPQFINVIILAFPVTPAIHGFLELNQMGASFTDIMGSVQILLAQIVIYGILGYYLINKKRNQYE